jgi:GAF domain-containing protein
MPGWSSSDFIVRGTYCDTDTIRKELGRLRRLFDAEAAILLFRQRETIFQSLMLVSHRKLKQQRELQARILQRPQQFPQTVNRVTSKQLWKTLRRLEPLSTLFQEFSADLHCSTISRTDSLPRYSGSGRIIDPSVEIKTTLIVGLVNPRARIRRSRSHLASLFEMIQASAPVRVHRDLLGILESDRRIDEAERTVDSPTVVSPSEIIHALPDSMLSTETRLQAIASALLQAATSLTGTSIGNVFLATGEKGKLNLAAAVGNTNPLSTIDANTETTVVSWVFNRQRPLLINDIQDFSRTHPNIEYKWVGIRDGPAYAELTVPIRQRHFGSHRYTVLGVINVEKVMSRDEGLFTYRDLALLRDIALRFCFWRSHLLFSLSAASLAQLTRRNVTLQGQQKANDNLERSTRADASLPEDLVAARDDISATLKDVHELTRSHSATVRLLTPDTRYLVRFCAFPPCALNDGDEIIAMSASDSANSWVARNGRECYVPHTKAKDRCANFPGLTNIRMVRPSARSELCIPIFVAGRLVGTLNLESTYRDGYSETIHLARAIAEQVGLSILRARRVTEDVIWSCTTHSTINAHQLLKCVDYLRDPAVAEGKPGRSLRDIADSIQRCVEGGRGDLSAAPSSAYEIAMTLIEELNFGGHVHWRQQPPTFLRHPPLIALAFRLALTMVLENSYNEALKSTNFNVLLNGRDRFLGGHRFLTIRVQNPVLLPLPDELARRLYRVPLSDERVHIGAFAAGAAMRAVGGDVYLTQNTAAGLTTKIDIPIENHSENI